LLTTAQPEVVQVACHRGSGWRLPSFRPAGSFLPSCHDLHTDYAARRPPGGRRHPRRARLHRGRGAAGARSHVRRRGRLREPQRPLGGRGAPDGRLVVALRRSGAAGTRRFVRIGLVAAALGWVVDAAAQLISQAMGFDYPPPSTWPPPRSSPRPVRSPTSPEPSGACAGSR
jgi:hypothetical protein